MAVAHVSATQKTSRRVNNGDHAMTRKSRQVDVTAQPFDPRRNGGIQTAEVFSLSRERKSKS